ncbi:MAG: ClpXP protease specificity-enhancing factor [Xanthomonadales bacterium]|jgi:stringent starvation protein B|uniref:ClpXP protease specificity-enhancing factor n=1 Tax=Thermomonas sp. TaxID=1971895 RepID=UPI001AC9A23E|nr:ClpXP protease specificity-enhancing factor [Xanthomonadales bacterium]HMT37498.1 ClpXP protease specificity-enhancing factor [Thermomonas sp.]
MAEPMPPAMTSHRPYLLRALYEWIVDNGMTPHVLVDATQPGVRVPAHAVKDGRIVLNIAERAVARLEMGNDALGFTARFGGVSQSVLVPLPAVIAIYARETGHGMALPDDPQGTLPADEVDAPTASAPRASDEGPGDDTPEPPKRGGHLRIVK